MPPLVVNIFDELGGVNFFFDRFRDSIITDGLVIWTRCAITFCGQLALR
jgi:hypothetical protein